MRFLLYMIGTGFTVLVSLAMFTTPQTALIWTLTIILMVFLWERFQLQHKIEYDDHRIMTNAEWNIAIEEYVEGVKKRV